MLSRACVIAFITAGFAMNPTANLQAQSPEVPAVSIEALLQKANNSKDPQEQQELMRQVRARLSEKRELNEQKSSPVRSSSSAKSRYAGSDDSMPDGPVPERNGLPVTSKGLFGGPPTNWSVGSYRGYRTGPGGGAVFGGNYGWGNTTPSPNPLISHRGSYPVYNVPYIGKNGTVAFGGMQFGRNGFSGPFFQTNKYGGNFFGFPIRFR